MRQNKTVLLAAFLATETAASGEIKQHYYAVFIDKKFSSPHLRIAELTQQGGTYPIAASLVLLLGIGLISLEVYFDG